MKTILLVASIILQSGPILMKSNEKVKYFLSDPAYNNSMQIEDYFNKESENQIVDKIDTLDIDTKQESKSNNHDLSIPAQPDLREPTFPSKPTIYTGDILTTYYDQIEFVEDYYKNLYHNFPSNNVGNCGYVAIAMLMQYYDVYWNDNIIDNKFNSGITYLDDFNDKTFISPGVKNIIYNLEEIPSKDDPNYKEKRAKAYRKYILDSINDEQSFIGFLYSIGVDLGIIKLDSIDIGTGVEYEIEIKLLNGYINEMNLNDFISVKSYRASDFSSNLFYSMLKLILKQGRPVIVGGDVSGSGHVALAYKYDEENDIIYGHNGWDGEENSYVNLNNFFDQINDYYFLEIKDDLHHEHNEIFRINGEDYCNCKLESHQCSAQHFYYGDANYHIEQCICGFTYKSHILTLLENRDSQCIYCNHVFERKLPSFGGDN